MFENPRRSRQARNFPTNVPKILDLKSSSEQIFFRKLPLGAPEKWIGHCFSCRSGEKCTEAINRPSEKVVLSFPIRMFQTEISVLFVKPFLKYQFQAFARGLPAIGKHDSTIKSGTHKIYRCWISLIIYPNHNPTSLIAHVNGKQIKIQGHPTRI